MTQHIAIIDPAAGASGDMLLGALIGVGMPESLLQELPARLGCPEVTVTVERVDRAGVSAVKVTVRLPGDRHEGAATAYEHSHDPHQHPHDHHAHPHAHSHAQAEGDAGGHGHHHVGALIRRIREADLPEAVKARAVACFELLAEAEGAVHGVAPADVALHEVGALDALVDIVGVVLGFHWLDAAAVYCRPVALGSGWVRAAHGIMPVPAPATAILLEGLPVTTAGPARGEATTPTGAALLRVLSQGAPPSDWTPRHAGGWGAGERNPPEYANVLRLILADAVPGADESIVVLATDIDDMNPEFMDSLRSALVDAGALDVQLWATQGKKGRPSFRVEALAAVPDVTAVTNAFLTHSSTLGVRRWEASRTTLARRSAVLTSEDGQRVRVKLSEAPDGVRAKPELDDLQALAARHGRSLLKVAGELQERVRRLVHDGRDDTT